MGYCNLYSAAQLGELTASRPIASTTFLGRYAFMDVTLSNFSNSGIDQVGILVKNEPRSILKHLGSTNIWNNNTKLGFELIMYDEKNAYSPIYHHDLNNIKANDWIIKSNRPDLYVIAPVHVVYPIDFRQVIQQHEALKSEITIVTAKVKEGKSTFLNADIVAIQGDGTIASIESNKALKAEVDVSLETYVLSSQAMEEMMTTSNQRSAFFGLKEMIAMFVEQKRKVHAYRYTGYVRYFDSLQAYRQHSLELLNWSVRNQLFLPNWPILTITHDTPPALYGPKAQVTNSFVANGAKVYGTVKNSIISRNVTIAEGAVVENSIVFTDTLIGKDVLVKNAVIDKYAKIITSKSIVGNDKIPLYIKQGEKA